MLGNQPMKNIMTITKTLFVVALLAVLGVLGFAWSGLYPVAVGTSHSAPVTWLLKTTRERSVAARSANLIVPADLATDERIAAGAGHYDSMCVVCHGKPGQEPTSSFDPPPPALYRLKLEPRAAFWTIKHGLKMTGMPHHLDHTDEENWDTVAFVQALSGMSSEEYLALTEHAVHHHGSHGGDHGGDQGSGSHGNDHDARHSHSRTGFADTRDHDQTTEGPEQVVEQFTQALIEGNGEAALSWLHPKATIIEGGQVQSTDEYAVDHLASDMAFLAQIEIEPFSRHVQGDDGQATIHTRSRFSGEFNGRNIDLESTEFATLIQTEEGWRISQIAWSTQPFSASKEGRSEQLP